MRPMIAAFVVCLLLAQAACLAQPAANSPKYSWGFANKSTQTLYDVVLEIPQSRGYIADAGILIARNDSSEDSEHGIATATWHYGPQPIPDKVTFTWRVGHDGPLFHRELAVAMRVPDPAHFRGTIWFVYDDPGNWKVVALSEMDAARRQSLQLSQFPGDEVLPALTNKGEIEPPGDTYHSNDLRMRVGLPKGYSIRPLDSTPDYQPTGFMMWPPTSFMATEPQPSINVTIAFPTPDEDGVDGLKAHLIPPSASERNIPFKTVSEATAQIAGEKWFIASIEEEGGNPDRLAEEMAATIHNGMVYELTIWFKANDRAHYHAVFEEALHKISFDPTDAKPPATTRPN